MSSTGLRVTYSPCARPYLPLIGRSITQLEPNPRARVVPLAFPASMRPVSAAILLCLLLAGCGGGGGGSGDQPSPKERAEQGTPVLGQSGDEEPAGPALGFPVFATKNTTRVGGADPVSYTHLTLPTN